MLCKGLCGQDFMQNDPTGTACFGTGRKVASDDASIPDAMCGDERRFGTGVTGCPLRVTSRHSATTFPTSAFGSKADIATRNTS